ADFDDLENLLDGARIEYSPKFAAPESNERFSVSLQAAAETEARRLLYVAITRAREKLVLEWPGYLADKDRVTYWSILSGGAGVTLRDGALRAGGEAFPCMVTQGGTELLPELEAAAEQATPELPVVGRRAVKARAAPAVLTPDSVAATELSAGAMTPAAVSVTTERYGSALELETDLSATALGTVLHRCFEVLGAKPERADRLQAILGGELNGDQVRRIAIQVARFERWIQA
ncbi:MAG: ATP-binding domain-containing protein, partial [Gammaproteobacteria bacterium]|nr:ATP-binding domain-containing protein [Gammaproteobacteria bacterium]NIR60129.1 ATP-binding domain-containing protein [Gammaproteobacteria bacterium]NIR90013.1 ATP-binding domain-containing protein [Gammaproteobacteria bacterium]